VPTRWHKTAWLKARETSAGVMAIIALLTLHRRYWTTSVLWRESSLLFWRSRGEFRRERRKSKHVFVRSRMLACCLGRFSRRRSGAISTSRQRFHQKQSNNPWRNFIDINFLALQLWSWVPDSDSWPHQDETPHHLRPDVNQRSCPLNVETSSTQVSRCCKCDTVPCASIMPATSQ
jgi:hypothetical protein